MPVLAQVTADGTTSTTVTSPDGDNFTIDDGDRAGGNLFHSFQDFSVPTNGSAFFNNADAIENIFSRVTGGNISSIDGLIRANGSANLFLINPAGIIFGQNARLDIGGSFLGSTADSILFPEGEFLATDTETPPLLTINAPIGLGIRDNPGDIVNQSVANNGNGLEVATGETITLLGGKVDLDGGRIFAPGGRVELGGLSAAGTVNINENGSLTFPEDITRSNVSLSNDSSVDVRAGGGGLIKVNAQNLELKTGSQLRAGIGEEVNSPEAQAGDINLNIIEAITIDGPESGIFNDVGEKIEVEDDDSDDSVASSAVGNAGKINIETGSLFITPGGRIGSTIYGQGNGGDVTVNADENIEIQGFEDEDLNSDNPTGIFSNLEDGAKGDSGTITISSNSLALTDRARLESSLGEGATGTAGNIVVNTSSLTLNKDSEFKTSLDDEAQGEGGDIVVTTNGSLTLNNSRFNAELEDEAQGKGGDIVINADIVSLNVSKLTSEIDEEAVGNTGNIEINANSLIVTAPKLGEDDRQAESEIEVEVENDAIGDAGDILINATKEVSLSGNVALQSTIKPGAQGNAGNIIIKTGLFSLDKEAEITTSISSDTLGNAGNVKIDADNVKIGDGALIKSTTSGQGNAGTIEINAEDSVIISGFSDFRQFVRAEDSDIEVGGSSGLFTSVDGEARGQGGNITISTPNLQILDGAVVSGSVAPQAQGNGGSIIIDAETLEISNGGQIIASSLGNGDSGDIDLNISDSIKISGSDPNFSERFIEVPIGKIDDGEIIAQPGEVGVLTEQDAMNEFSSFTGIEPESGIFADNQGQGSGGSVAIGADSLTLEDDARISAATDAGEGGEIFLTIDDSLTLGNNSTITAQAFENANGGNVTIDAEFIIASLNQNNDIIASAERGRGGNINITAEGVFGLEERSSTPTNNTNDIDASSEFGLDGTVSINTPDLSTFQEAIEASEIVQTETLGTSACSGRGATGGSNFNITGKGGVPPELTAPLSSDTIFLEGKPIPIGTGQSERVKREPIKPLITAQGEIYPARGIIFLENGDIILTAYPTDNVQRTPHSPNNCGKS